MFFFGKRRFDMGQTALRPQLTSVGLTSKKLHEGHLGVFFDPQKEIVTTSELLLRIFQPNFTGVYLFVNLQVGAQFIHYCTSDAHK